MVDDDAPFRESFAQLLNREPGLRVARQFDSIQPMLVALAEERLPDIILLDLNIGKEDGLSAIQPVKKLAPGVKILMLTTFTKSHAEAEAFRLGAHGFLLKIYEIEEIVGLIHQSFYHPRDPRLFPNLAFRTRRQGSKHPKSALEPRVKERRGFFNALRQLYRPRRRQAAD
jgi:DNA-binding NarL/FixJ family response regulator